ncbi:cyclic pyranopterin monophosphate synthase MoaC [Syntrophus aciditrophicus]|uniref:Cyclic pyranopterin monophosphate synthase n=1 Tax=Syntrophus aciditrophicus (strain SB) TaxID=56780 RepID=Q2LRJ8_SYNAS|nr:cyclic pyranopterin monophosphate synthase MoaC [Syntrophus aciditrophicus]ABC76712.1 molybdenum cofactor biosynthesis protein C [Syntrophus aciditrophicus SB]OPY18553.1 MAG: Cyclic pyranopterin monophosphate synthase accessory protein [Syntrophus sp. PtaB.Bin075]
MKNDTGKTGLSHLDDQGQAKMVDVTAKDETIREAVACGTVRMQPATVRLIQEGGLTKGDVFSAARLAGIMAAKKTWELIPLCHPLMLTSVDVFFSSNAERGEITLEARSTTIGRTGVEMEALTAVSVAALTIYDMCKAVDRGMVISEIFLQSKKGGRSGTFDRSVSFPPGRSGS